MKRDLAVLLAAAALASTSAVSREPAAPAISRLPPSGERTGAVAQTSRAQTSVAQTFRSASIEKFEFSEPHMGTIVRIVLYASNASLAEDGARAAFARIKALDETLSDYRESSELARLSQRAGNGPVAAGDDLFRVLRAAQQIAADSDGAFDVTVGPLSVLWRRARRQGELPGADALAAARALVGHDRLQLDEAARTVRLQTPGMQLDAGGIAKGFAADEAAVVLSRRGIKSALVAAGGDIVASDAPPGRPGWRVAVRSLDGAAAPPGYVTLANAAVSTSGDAEQFLTVNGIRYSHIFDPRTGQALTGRRSVTVLARNGTASDALATAVSVLGADRGLRLIEKIPGTAALIAEDAPEGRRAVESSRWRTLSGFTEGDR